MSSAARSAREEERRINARTLVIASAASAAAAVITSQFWIAGTPYAAAITPVIVALVSELLNRPAEKLAERFTLESDPLPEAAGAGPPPRSEAVAPDPAPDQPPQLRRAGSPAVRSRAPSTLSAGDAAPVRVYRQPSPAGVRARRALPWRTILVTAGLAFVIAAVVLTVPELIAGQSLGRGDGGTSILGNDRSRSNDAQEQEPVTPEPQPSQPQPTQPDAPAERPDPAKPPPEDEPPATSPGGGTGTTPRTTTTPAAPR